MQNGPDRSAAGDRLTSLSFIQPKGLAPPKGYSQVVVSRGPLVHVAGQVAQDEHGATVGVGNFGAQVERVFANIEIALCAAGSAFPGVVALTIYCTAAVEREQLSHLRESIRRRVGNSELPAITLLFIHSLMHPDWLVEVQAVAVLNG